MKRITSGKGFVTPILAVILSAVLLLGVAVSGLSDQMSLTSRYDWNVAQARSAADTGLERAKAKLLENPMWDNGSEVTGTIDQNVPDAQIENVDVKQESLTINSDGSITRIVTVTSTGASGKAVNKVSKTVQAKISVNIPVPDGGNGGGGNGGNGGGGNGGNGGNNNQWDIGWLLALNDISLETFNTPLLSQEQIASLTSSSGSSSEPSYSLSTATFGSPYSSIIKVNSASEASYITNIISDAAAADFANQAIQSKNFAAALDALWNYNTAAFEASLNNLMTADTILTDSLQGLLDPVDASLKFMDAMNAATANSLSQMNSLLLMVDVNLSSLTSSYNTNYSWNSPSYSSWDYGYSSYGYSSPSYSYSSWNNYSYSTPSYSSWDYGWNSYSYSSWNSYSYSSWSWW